MSRGDLSEVEWRILRVLLPVERDPGKRGRGRPPEDNRNIINGILWRLRTGAPWRDVPEKYGNWNSIYRRFRRWSAAPATACRSGARAPAMAIATGDLDDEGRVRRRDAWGADELEEAGGVDLMQLASQGEAEDRFGDPPPNEDDGPSPLFTGYAPQTPRPGCAARDPRAET